MTLRHIYEFYVIPNIVNNNFYIIHAAAISLDNISVDTVSYSSSNITVYLNFSVVMIGQGVDFSVSTYPPGHMTVVNNTNDSKVIQLTLLYNIVYNVSIESSENPCGQTGASTQIQLKYSKYSSVNSSIQSHNIICIIIMPMLNNNNIMLLQLIAAIQWQVALVASQISVIQQHQGF